MGPKQTYRVLEAIGGLNGPNHPNHREDARGPGVGLRGHRQHGKLRRWPRPNSAAMSWRRGDAIVSKGLRIRIWPGIMVVSQRPLKNTTGCHRGKQDFPGTQE
ncbi:hypothetical protein O181_050122 [Austropuccinia psidii MF-1]|uniref:Uncharacterized protein n=1 Tax=Austropuccinia psidii MF-1 TaxID=1389203 RepID=A0A9Q3E320_9BASI|nr:hypothetical protein [Austropuccinia psidii MF-1]